MLLGLTKYIKVGSDDRKCIWVPNARKTGDLRFVRTTQPFGAIALFPSPQHLHLGDGIRFSSFYWGRNCPLRSRGALSPARSVL